jgi:Protein RETICULATA-related
MAPAHTAGCWCASQMKPPGVQEWGVAKRAGAVARNGTKLLGVGFFASLFGVTVTNVLVKVPASSICRSAPWHAVLHGCRLLCAVLRTMRTG